jgi:hypothetical protein
LRTVSAASSVDDAAPPDPEEETDLLISILMEDMLSSLL